MGPGEGRGVQKASLFNLNLAVQATVQPVPQVSAATVVTDSPVNLEFEQNVSTNYIKMLDTSKKKIFLLYDVAYKRG